MFDSTQEESLDRQNLFFVVFYKWLISVINCPSLLIKWTST